MVSCAFINCDVNRRNNLQNYKFHRIPSRPDIRQKWIRIINREKWTPHKYSAICSKHFEDKCFIQRRYYRMLMKDSIPTLFVPIKLPPKRSVCSYVHRDIICTPQEVAPPRQLTPEPSSVKLLTLTPRKKKFLDKTALLKRKISEKNREIRKLKQKTNRMKKRIITLKEVVNDISNRAELNDHRNEIQVACSNNILQKLVDRINSKATKKKPNDFVR